MISVPITRIHLFYNTHTYTNAERERERERERHTHTRTHTHIHTYTHTQMPTITNIETYYPQEKKKKNMFNEV